MKGQFHFYDHYMNAVYLDSAASTLMPRPVVDAITEYNHIALTVGRTVYSEDWSREVDRVRLKVQEALGDSREVAFTSGATESINMIAKGLPPMVRRKIIVSTVEHVSNILPWSHMQGHSLHFVNFADLLESIDERVAILAITEMGNVNAASPQNLERILLKCQDCGVISVLDSTQAIRYRQNLRVKPTFRVFSGHKVYGPTGIGVLCGDLDLLSPMKVGSGHITDPLGYISSGHSAAFLDASPFHLETGTPNISGIIGLGAALTFRKCLPPSDDTLFPTLDAGLRQRDYVDGVYSTWNPGIMAFKVKGHDCHEVAADLFSRGIYVRSGNCCTTHFQDVVRISLGCYNDRRDISTFFKVLDFLYGSGKEYE